MRVSLNVLSSLTIQAGPKTVLEVGCGAGNTIFTLLNHNENPHLTVYATDYAPNAVEVVKANPIYPVPPHGKGRLRASVWDISAAGTLPEGLEAGTVDVLTCIFCFSALHPVEWNAAVRNLWSVCPWWCCSRIRADASRR